MANIKLKICVVTVTYGNRWAFLQQVIKSVISHHLVSSIILVDNASFYNLEDKLLTFNEDKITLLKQHENTGSAMGYQIGLKYAQTKINPDFVLLLDDDNVIKPNAINILLAMWKEIVGANNMKALFCLRIDRIQHIKIAQGKNPNQYYLVPDNFMGFHLFKIFKNQYNKFFDKFRKNVGFKDSAKIPYVPYGGLFIHTQMIQKIGYPNEQYFLYVDDSEYTYRITKSGATIWLIPSAQIIDVDKSQGINYKNKIYRSQLLDLWSFRTYYLIRNRLHFYSQHSVHNKFIFTLNKTIFLLNLRIVSILSNKKATYNKLKQAVNHGLAGKLGKTNDENF